MKKLKNIRIFILAGCIILIIFIFYVVSNKDQHVLKITHLTVGRGQAVFVRTPHGNNFLINAGSDTSILRALGTVMPFYDQTIDAVLATDDNLSSIGGMPAVLKNYHVGMYISTDTTSNSATEREIQKEISDEKIQKNIVQSESTVNLGDGIFLKIIFVNDDKTGESMAIQLVSGAQNIDIVPNK